MKKRMKKNEKKEWKKNEKKEWKKKKVNYLCYEVRFWYVKTLDLADFKYVSIYPLDSFFLEIWPFKNTEKRSKKAF